MIMLNEISLQLGDKIIFNNISLAINRDQRIGLVGRNGSGKSTLLRVISGELGLDAGSITIEKNKKIGYMPQEVVLLSDKTVLDEALSVHKGVLALKAEYDALEARVHASDIICTPEELEHYAHLITEVSEFNFEQLCVEAHKILDGLGFSPQQKEMLVANLSVGWKMRLILAKLLLSHADFYLFDEPTNHLDIVAKDWFLDFLKNARFGFVLVSHDRYFLDHVCEHIFELSRGNGKLYRGNYEIYLTQKEQDRLIREAAYLEQQREIKRKTATIDRFRAKASKASMAQSMLRSLEKIEVIELEPELPTIRLSFPQVKQSGRIVLNIKNARKDFDSCPVFDHLSFDVFRQEKIALIAANGKGKTTLLNLIAGKYESQSGEIAFGHNVSWAFFEQDQELSLNKNNTILQEVEQVCTSSEQRMRVRPLLGAFLFSGDDVEKKIRVLSGGEKNRVAMVKVLLQDANFLLLDEPTNHLDLQSKEILLQALQQYPGTILFVSHDRSFLDGLATRIFELTPNKIISYKGNYESYIYQKSHEQDLIKLVDKVSGQEQKNTQEKKKQDIGSPQETKQYNKLLYDLNKKLASLERKIEVRERDRQSLYGQYELGDVHNDGFATLNAKISDVTHQLDALYAEWEVLHKEVNEFKGRSVK